MQQMQQMSAQPQIPQTTSIPQQYVQQTYSPAVAPAATNAVPEMQTQPMPMQLQQPELTRTCSSGSDISQSAQVQYLMHLPAAAEQAPASPQPGAAQPVAAQPVQYLMHLQPSAPMGLQPG